MRPTMSINMTPREINIRRISVLTPCGFNPVPSCSPRYPISRNVTFRWSWNVSPTQPSPSAQSLAMLSTTHTA